MKEHESMDAESAYGSEISSNYSFLMKKDAFKIEEPTPKSQTRWQWLKYKLRDYMVLEAVFFLILVFLLITCYRISSQNQETHRMISSIQSQLDSIQKPIEKDFMNINEDSEETMENEFEKLKSTLKEDLKEVRMKPDEELEAIHPIISSTSHSKETQDAPISRAFSNNSTLKRFNAASLIAGSSIDSSLSSSSSLNPSIGYDQSSLVLVDRPEPPVNKAWCTFDKNPVLTVNLGYYINPTAVSYQHSKWNGTIPDDAPKEYSVEACLDSYCVTRKPLFAHCEYNQHGLQEQICNSVSNDSLSSPVAKLQFQFKKNHGNTERTCVSLVRVYSETEVVKEKKLRSLEDTTTCLKVNHRYHHYPKMYKYFTFKNCTVLYSKGCCQECPECCEECDIKDINKEAMLVIFLTVLITSYVICLLCILKRVRRSK